jgi:YggT family protein
MNVLARVISLIGGVIIALLGLRFLFILLGANPLNGFVNFIYDVSRPFVQPFYGMFSTEPTFTKAHFELATLVAIIVYALVTLLLVKLATIGSHRNETY